MKTFRNGSRRWMIIVVIGGVLLFFRYTSFLTPIQSVAVRILAPVQHFVYSIPSWFSSDNVCEQDSVSQQESIDNLIVENTHLRTRVEELGSLEDIIAFNEKYEQDVVPARVLSMNADDVAQVMIVDQGSREGIQAGNAVVAQNGVLVGKVISVEKDFSRVLSIVDSSSIVAARIQNSMRSPGLVKGEKGLALRIELVPQNEEIRPDDIVVTSGIENEIPPNIVIGQIERVVSSQGDLFQEAFLRSLASFDRLDIVGIVK